MTLFLSCSLSLGREAGEKEKEDWPCQAPHSIQQAICERCAHIWKEEGTQRQLLNASVHLKRSTKAVQCL